jgi:glycosyltransferase involved in cell wall biosynthesis
MRIAYLTADFGVPVLGTKGASAHVRGLVRGLESWGHDVLVLASNVGDGSEVTARFPVQQLPFGTAVLELYEALKQEQLCQGTRLAKDLRNLLYSLSLELQGRLVLEQARPDLIYERYCLFSTAGLELARYFDVPFILEVNAPLVLEQQRMRGLSLPMVARVAERLVLTRADHVIVVSDWLREYVIEEGVSRDRVTVMPNGADPDLFHPRSKPSDLRHTLGWDEHFVMGFVGSMKSWHGVSTMLDALRILGGASSGFRLLLVGAGPELPRLEREIDRWGLGECVHLTGAVPHEEVPEMIAATDVVVAPYAPDAEGYFSPVKLFEYMAMACPVVAARVGQAGEVIEHGRTGWLYAPGDAGELAGVMQMLSTNTLLRERVGASARDRVLARYTWRHNAARVVEIAQAIAGRRQQPDAGRQLDVA